VSRARCGILHAAAQNRDRTKESAETIAFPLVRLRISSAPRRKGGALRCIRGTEKSGFASVIPGHAPRSGAMNPESRHLRTASRFRVRAPSAYAPE
jgi:hypothetical protein